jgi:uncharacterized repeat protein (TIGR01451 family)
MRQSTRRTVRSGVAVCVALLLAGCMPRQPWVTEVFSENADGTGGGGGQSGYIGGPDYDVSPDGTTVLFASSSSRLVAGDTNGRTDLFVRDVATGVTTLVTANAAGTASAGGESLDGSLSSDGTKVVFTSDAGDLGPVDTNGQPDVYVRDLVAGTTTLVSVNEAGADGGDAASGGGSFSGDGTKVAFTSSACDILPVRCSGVRESNVFVRDLVAGTTTLVSADPTGASGGGTAPLFSPDGTKVAFLSHNGVFGPPDAGADPDHYVHDLSTGATTLLTVNHAGTDGAGAGANGVTFSPDGSRVLFHSDASDLVPSDTNGATDVFVRDLAAGTTSLVSVDATGSGSGNHESFGGRFSPDGEQVVFQSTADDLGPSDVGSESDIYVRDLTTGTTTLVSRNADGSDGGNAASRNPSFDEHGTKVVFTSRATDLVPSGPATENIYVADLVTGTISMASPRADGTGGGNNHSDHARFVPGTGQVVFVSWATNLDPRPSGAIDLFISTYRAADLELSLTAAPEPAPRGDTLTYTATVDNAGPDPAAATDLALLLPEGVVFQGVSTDAGTCAAPSAEAPRVVRCDLGDTEVAGTATVTVATTVSDDAGTSLDALAAVASHTADVDDHDTTAVAHSTVVG